jgi:abortive infection bacteriophage resistance protein
MDKFKKTLSLPKLNKYKLNEGFTDNEILKLYLINVRLQEAFLPALHFLEVSLRNKIYYELGNKFKNNDWLFDGVTLQLHNTEAQRLLKGQKTQAHKKRTNFTNESLIAELSFGFWVNLLKKYYKSSIWMKTGYFEAVFPNFNIKVHDRTNYLHRELYKIKKLRDRIAHHEDIIVYHNSLSNNLDEYYKNINKIIGYMCKDTQKLLTNICRFNETYEEYKKLKTSLKL